MENNDAEMENDSGVKAHIPSKSTKNAPSSGAQSGAKSGASGDAKVGSGGAGGAGARTPPPLF